MDDPATAKEDLVDKYDNEAKSLDTEQWLSAGNDIRVPESRAAQYFVARKVTKALDLLGKNATNARDALEIGCSFGQMTALLAQRFTSLTAVDLSPRSIDLAKKRLERYGVQHVRFITDDAESLRAVPSEAFDVVFSFSTIRFCPRPENALAAIRSKLRPGGVAILDFPNRLTPWHSLVKPVLGIKPHIHDRLYTVREAEELFIGGGFSVDRVERFLFTSRRLPAPFLPLFRIADTVLERIPPFPAFAGIIMIKGTKK
jgi:SAM-dependent methyltransferase